MIFHLSVKTQLHLPPAPSYNTYNFRSYYHNKLYYYENDGGFFLDNLCNLLIEKSWNIVHMASTPYMHRP